MFFTLIEKFGSIWLIFILISISTVYGQQSTVEVTTISVENINEINHESNSSELSIPKVQSRFFNWLMNGLNGQSSDGLNGLGGLLRPNAGSNSPFNGLGASLGSAFGNRGFGMRPLSNEQSQMIRPPMGRPPMSSLPMGSLPMGRPPMGPPPMGPPPMGPPPMGSLPMGPPPMGQMGQSQYGSQSPMGSQMGMGSNYAGQPNNQMGGQMGQMGQMGGQMNQMGQMGPMGGQMDMSTDDPYGDYGGGDDFFTSMFTFLFGPSGNSNGGSNSGSGRGNNNYGQGGQSGRGRPNSVSNTGANSVSNTGTNSNTNSGSNSGGMSSEDWSNYLKMIQTLYSAGDGGGGGGGGGMDLSSIIGQATSLIQGFQGS